MSVSMVSTILVFMLAFARADEQDGVIEQLVFEFEHMLEDYLVEWKLLTEPLSSLFSDSDLRERSPNASIEDLSFSDAKDLLIGRDVILDAGQFAQKDRQTENMLIFRSGKRNHLFRNIDAKTAEENKDLELQRLMQGTEEIDDMNNESVHTNIKKQVVDGDDVHRQGKSTSRYVSDEHSTGEPVNNLNHSDTSNEHSELTSSPGYQVNNTPGGRMTLPGTQPNPDELHKDPRQPPRGSPEIVVETKTHQNSQRSRVPVTATRPVPNGLSGGKPRPRRRRARKSQMPVIYMPGQEKKRRKCVNVHGIFSSHNAYNYLSFVTGIISLILNVNNNINNNNNNNNINDNNGASNNNVDANSNTQTGNQIVVFPGRRRRRRRTFLDTLLETANSSYEQTHQEDNDQEASSNDRSSPGRWREPQNSCSLRSSRGMPPILREMLPSLFTASVPYIQILGKGNTGSTVEQDLRLDDFGESLRRTWRQLDSMGGRHPEARMTEFYIRTALRAILSEQA